MAEKRPIKKGKQAGENFSLEELVEHLIAQHMSALEKNQIKVTTADLVRVRRLQKELAPPPLQVEVTWIDGWDSDD